MRKYNLNNHTTIWYLIRQYKQTLKKIDIFSNLNTKSEILKDMISLSCDGWNLYFKVRFFIQCLSPLFSDEHCYAETVQEFQ